MKEKTIRTLVMASIPICQLSIIAGNYQYMFSKESGWNYLSIVGYDAACSSIIRYGA